MIKISLPENPDLVAVLRQIKEATDGTVELLLPAPPEQWNVLSLKTLAKQASDWGKEVQFSSQDEAGQTLLGFLGGGKGEDIGGEAAPAKGSLVGRIRFRIALGFLKSRFVLIGVGVLILLLGATVAGLYFFAQATVVLTLDTSPLVKTVPVIIDPALTAPDPEKMALPAISVVVEETGSFEGDASGEKEVGSKATGTVTAYNYDTDKGKQFPKGSPLITSSGLKFFLDEAISLAEASTSADPTNPAKRIIDPEEIEVKVTAEAIGSNYNIKKETTLNFSDLDESFWEDVFTKAAADFAGGESKQVTVAKVEDRDRLLAESLDGLSKKCSSGLSGKLVGDQRLEEKANEVAVVEKTFSPALGEETAKVKLDLKVRCEGLAYSEGEIQQLLAGTFNSLVPEGFRLSSEIPEVTILTAEKNREGSGFTFQTKVKGDIVPELDEEAIREKLVGQSFKTSEAYFSSLANISSYRVNLRPPMPWLLGRYPLSKDRIHIQITQQE